MEKKLVLKAEKRTTAEKAHNIRKEKFIPGVVYGKKQEALSIKFDYSEFLKLYRTAGESKIITISVDSKNIDVLVYEVVNDPVKGEFQHVDFYAITKGEKVTTKIPLVFIGTAKATIDGAIIEEQIKEIEVKVLPKDLVDSIEVDISILENIGDSIRLSSLIIDREKFEVLGNPDDVVVMATKPAEEKIEDEPSEPTEGDEQAKDVTEE